MHKKLRNIGILPTATKGGAAMPHPANRLAPALGVS
jgi:hypothetical protein